MTKCKLLALLSYKRNYDLLLGNDVYKFDVILLTLLPDWISINLCSKFWLSLSIISVFSKIGVSFLFLLFTRNLWSYLLFSFNLIVYSMSGFTLALTFLLAISSSLFLCLSCCLLGIIILLLTFLIPFAWSNCFDQHKQRSFLIFYFDYLLFRKTNEFGI